MSRESPAAAPLGRDRRYVLAVLLIVYTFNLVDRQILAILIEPVKRDLQLSDTHIGFLTGVAFALFYAVLGVPISRIADRGNRRNLLGVSLALWSAMTALSGLTQNVWQLALARMGVGIGEAGCNPAAHSMLADLFGREERSTAMGIYALGIPFGIFLGLLVGGWLNALYGWRITLMAVGLPGLLLAVAVRYTIAEPVRGAADAVDDAGAAPALRQVVRFLAARRAFVHLAAGCAITTLVGGCMSMWTPSFLARAFGMGTADIGLWLGLIAGIPGGIGIFLGGWLSDRAGARDARWRLWTVSIALSLAVPFAVAAYFAKSGQSALWLLVLPFLLGNFFQATTFAQTQALVGVRMRATAAAILFLVLNLAGYGLGPQLVGVLSDMLASQSGDRALGNALAMIMPLNLWAAVHYYRAGHHLPRDLERGGAL